MTIHVSLYDADNAHWWVAHVNPIDCTKCGDGCLEWDDRNETLTCLDCGEVHVDYDVDGACDCEREVD